MGTDSGHLVFVEVPESGTDVEAGGEIAANLNDLYAYMTRRLIDANVENDVAILDGHVGPGYAENTEEDFETIRRLARTEGRLPSREAVTELEAVYDWSSRTRDGDLSLAGVVSEDSGLLPFVTSTADNCLGGECPDFEECFVARARREAQEADIVVVNHHLLFADMAIKQSGFGEVLPGAGAFIVDDVVLVRWSNAAEGNADDVTTHPLPGMEARYVRLSIITEIQRGVDIGPCPAEVRSSTASRRCPSPSAPSMWVPRPSGPRWARTSVIRSRRSGSTGRSASK